MRKNLILLVFHQLINKVRSNESSSSWDQYPHIRLHKWEDNILQIKSAHISKKKQSLFDMPQCSKWNLQDSILATNQTSLKLHVRLYTSRTRSSKRNKWVNSKDRSEHVIPWVTADFKVGKTSENQGMRDQMGIAGTETKSRIFDPKQWNVHLKKLGIAERWRRRWGLWAALFLTCRHFSDHQTWHFETNQSTEKQSFRFERERKKLRDRFPNRMKPLNQNWWCDVKIARDLCVLIVPSQVSVYKYFEYISGIMNFYGWLILFRSLIK